MFHKTRYLRPGGRFNAIWRAAHDISMDTVTETEDSLNDVCEDIMQLMNPSEYARRSGQTLSLRFASTLIAGVAERRAQLADDLLRDTICLLNDMEIKHPELHSPNLTGIAQESKDEPFSSSQCRGPINPDTASTSENRPETSSLKTNDEENYSMSTENNEEEEEDDDSDVSDSHDDHDDDNNKGDHTNGEKSKNKKTTSQLDNTLENTPRFPESENSIRSAENPPNTSPISESHVPSLSAHTPILSPFQEKSSPIEQNENVAPNEQRTTYEVGEGAVNWTRSPILPSGVVTTHIAHEKSPIIRNVNICYNKRKIPLNQVREETPSKKGRLDDVLMELPLDLSKKPRVLEEPRSDFMDQDVSLYLPPPVSSQIDAEDVQSPQPQGNANPTSAIDDQVENLRTTDEEMNDDSHVWVTMTDTTLSAASYGPARVSEQAPQASLPPGMRGLPTAPATRRRRVRRPPLVYRARKLRLTTHETTTVRSLTSSNAPKADQSSTQHIEDQDMRGADVSLLNTSITEDTHQLVRLDNVNTVTPPTFYHDVILANSPMNQNQNDKNFGRAAQENVPLIADTSPYLQAISDTSRDSSWNGEEALSQTVTVSADIHPEPIERVSHTSPAQSPETFSNSTTEETKTTSHSSSASLAARSGDQNDPDATEIIEENSHEEISEHEEEVKEEHSRGRKEKLSVILEVTEPDESIYRSLVDDSEIEENTEEDEQTRTTENATKEDVTKNTNTEESSFILRVSTDSSDMTYVSRVDEIVDDKHIYEELNVSGEQNEVMQNSDAESITSHTSQNSLGLDCISYIYKRSDPRRAVVMRNKVSEDPELNREIWKNWRSTFV